jgi:hypothetical protein
MAQWVSKLDDYGQAAWLLLTVAALLIAWPIGIAIFLYLLWSGRVTLGWNGPRSARDGLTESIDRAGRGAREFFRSHKVAPFSGNDAFDTYRQELLKRLEDEEREFRAYLDRLRKARDQAEFEQFMADRRAEPKSE